MATTRNCTRPIPPSRSGISFHAARATLTNSIVRNYDRGDVIERLVLLDAVPDNFRAFTTRSLAMRVAWALLPGGLERAKGGR